MIKIQGVGINDASYPVTKTSPVTLENGEIIRVQTWVCPYYAAWKNMIARCYSSTLRSKKTSVTYLECQTSKNWLTFSNFLHWASQIGIENHQLDKDILVLNNKIYSEDTCLLVPRRVNMLLVDRGAKRNTELLLGVYDISKTHSYPLKKGFRARVGTSDGPRSLGNYYTKEDAHFAWQSGKADYILEVVRWWESDPYFKRSFNKRAEESLMFRYDLLNKCTELKIILDRLP